MSLPVMHAMACKRSVGSMNGRRSIAGDGDDEQGTTLPRPGSTLRSAVGAMLGARSSVDGMLPPSQSPQSPPPDTVMPVLARLRADLLGMMLQLAT